MSLCVDNLHELLWDCHSEPIWKVDKLITDSPSEVLGRWKEWMSQYLETIQSWPCDPRLRRGGGFQLLQSWARSYWGGFLFFILPQFFLNENGNRDVVKQLNLPNSSFFRELTQQETFYSFLFLGQKKNIALCLRGFGSASKREF